MQNGLPIAHARKDCNLFILDLAMPKKFMQVNANIRAMMTNQYGRLIHFVSRIKKIHI